jgi:hypothetical protein
MNFQKKITFQWIYELKDIDLKNIFW